MSLVGACSSCDSVSLCQQTWNLSPEFQWSEYSLQASSPLAEKVHRYLEFRPISWPKIKARNRACPRSWVTSTYPCSPHSHLHRLDSEGSRNQDGSPRCSSKAFPGWADTSPLAGKVPGRLEPEKGSASEALWLCLSQKLLASIVHTLTCAD